MTPLRRWRTDQGLSLGEVADLTGFSVSMLSRAERGERCLSPRARVLISRRLDVPIRELFLPAEVGEDEPAVTS